MKQITLTLTIAIATQETKIIRQFIKHFQYWLIEKVSAAAGHRT